MLENGKESTKKLILRLAPTMAKSASPKSACASPGLQTRSRKDSATLLLWALRSWT